MTIVLVFLAIVVGIVAAFLSSPSVLPLVLATLSVTLAVLARVAQADDQRRPVAARDDRPPIPTGRQSRECPHCAAPVAPGHARCPKCGTVL